MCEGEPRSQRTRSIVPVRANGLAGYLSQFICFTAMPVSRAARQLITMMSGTKFCADSAAQGAAWPTASASFADHAFDDQPYS